MGISIEEIAISQTAQAEGEEEDSVAEEEGVAVAVVAAGDLVTMTRITISIHPLIISKNAITDRPIEVNE